MSALAELALVMAAFEALPNGTTQERTAWILQRKREIEAGQKPAPRMARSPVKPFSEVADDPTIARCREDSE